MSYAINIKPARHSDSSDLPVRIALVDYRILGTQEQTHPKRTLRCLLNMLSHGYEGPAISVFQRQTDAIYHELPAAIPTQLALTEYGKLGVADGHHRLATISILDRLHLLKSPIIPAQLLPVREDIIRIETTKIDGSPLSSRQKPLTITDIESYFPYPDRTIPPTITTRFEVKFHDGSYDRVRNGQPDVVVSRLSLLEQAYNLDVLQKTISDLEPQLIDNSPAYIDQLVEALSKLEREAVHR